MNWRKRKKLYRRHCEGFWRNGSNHAIRTMLRVLCISEGRSPYLISWRRFEHG